VIRLKSWPKQWNDAAMRRIANRFERPRRSLWPLIGVLGLGLVAGAAIGGYAVSQRAQLKRISTYARRMKFGLAEIGTPDREPAEVISVPRSNHGRKATAEV
jgi:hypothetical protein